MDLIHVIPNLKNGGAKICLLICFTVMQKRVYTINNYFWKFKRRF